MKAMGRGVSRKELTLIRETLKANPGCVIRITVDLMGSGGYGCAIARTESRYLPA